MEADRVNQMTYLEEDPNKYLIRHIRLLDDLEYKYQCVGDYWYFSKRYGKWLFLEDGHKSDGATSAVDIHSNAWWWHDILCEDGNWADGTLASNWVASTVLGDILWEEAKYFKEKGEWKLFIKRRLESVFWWWATWLRGGGKARENGMFHVKNNLVRVDG